MFDIKALDLEKWSDEISSRSELPALVRKLVITTGGSGITKCSIPAFENVGKPGWDGLVKTRRKTLFNIPQGDSYWEMGTSKDIKEKANSDYESRKTIASNKAIFIFVTSRNWPGKDKWIQEKNQEGHWNQVIAYDANDLENWLEKSVATQVWLAEKIGMPDINAIYSLDSFQSKWQANCSPKFPMGMFEHFISEDMEKNRKSFDEFINNEIDSLCVYSPFKEGLAFLSTVFASTNALQNMIVIEKPEMLLRIANSPEIILVFANLDVKNEFGALNLKHRHIRIDCRNNDNYSDGISLGLFSRDKFRDLLKDNKGFNEDTAEMYFRETGGSLTALRRRLSGQAPEWTKDTDMVRKFIPLILAGCWNADNAKDMEILCRLAETDNFGKIEEFFSDLRNSDTENLVWSEGSLMGVTSKLDSFFNAGSFINRHQLRIFYDIANEFLPKSSAYRETSSWNKDQISNILLKGICDTLILLRKFGHLIKGKLDLEPEIENMLLIREVLTNLTPEKLSTQALDFQSYADIAPDEFLTMIEKEIVRNDELKNHAMKNDKSNIGIYLLFALEILAWYPEYLARVVNILLELTTACPANIAHNTPMGNLCSIFRYVAPQTCADENQRIFILEKMLETHPGIAWVIMKEQIGKLRHSVLSNQKPLWHSESQNHKNCIEPKFELFCYEKMIQWKNPSVEQICDMAKAAKYEKNRQKEMMDFVSKHSRNMSDEEKAEIRESIRINMNPANSGIKDRINSILDELTPSDPCIKHRWLFSSKMPEYSHIDRRDRRKTLQSMNSKFGKMRKQAVEEIFSSRHGLFAIKEFTGTIEYPEILGKYLIYLLSDSDIEEIIGWIFKNRGNQKYEKLFAGLFHGHKRGLEKRIIDVVCNYKGINDKDRTFLLTLLPFTRPVWDIVEQRTGYLDKLYDAEYEYWKSAVLDSNINFNDKDQEYAIRKFLNIGSIDSDIHAFKLCNTDIADHHLLFEILRRLSTYDKKDFRHAMTYDNIVKIENIIAVLEKSKTIKQHELAMLELSLIGMGYLDTKGMHDSLDTELSENPKLLSDFINLNYSNITSRKINDADRKFIHDMGAFLEFGSNVIPGTDNNGNIDHDKLADWIDQVRMNCHSMLTDQADVWIGDFLGKLHIEGEEWPCKTIADVLEKKASNVLLNYFIIGYQNNQQGMIIRSTKDNQNQKDARISYYNDKADKYHSTHPVVAKMLRDIAHDNINEAKRWDKKVCVFDRGIFC